MKQCVTTSFVALLLVVSTGIAFRSPAQQPIRGDDGSGARWTAVVSHLTNPPVSDAGRHGDN